MLHCSSSCIIIKEQPATTVAHKTGSFSSLVVRFTHNFDQACSQAWPILMIQTKDALTTPNWRKSRKNTAQIFVQFVRLHSHSASSNAVAADRASPDPSTEPTTSPSPSSRQCLQVQESSRSATRGPSTLPRQKSREATRKDPHPKAVHSTRQPTAQIVSY